MKPHAHGPSLRRAIFALVLALGPAAPELAAAEMTPALAKALDDAKYVYVSSTRKDGTLSDKAEIWFLYEKGTVYVGTRPDSWRVKRIRWGRPDARIWVGSPDGPSYAATGAIVDSPALQEKMFEVFAKKYPDGWPRHEKSFRDGFEDGSRVMVGYTAKDADPNQP